jgi:hypothetical protein
MKIQVNTQISLPDEEALNLATILECTPDQLGKKLSEFVRPALTEYTSMFLGTKVFKRGSDLLEYRLFLLITTTFGNLIPSDQEVSELFQTSTSESRSLIRAVMSKYQYPVKEAVQRSLVKILQSAKHAHDGDPYEVVIASQNLVEELNRVLAGINGNLPLVSKVRDSVGTYRIQPSSYEELKKLFLEKKPA